MTHYTLIFLIFYINLILLHNYFWHVSFKLMVLDKTQEHQKHGKGIKIFILKKIHVKMRVKQGSLAIVM